MSGAHHRRFGGCRSGVLAVSDYAPGKVVTTVPIGSGVDGAGFDATTSNAFGSTIECQRDSNREATRQTGPRRRDRTAQPWLGQSVL